MPSSRTFAEASTTSGRRRRSIPASLTRSPSWPSSSDTSPTEWLRHKLTSANATVPLGELGADGDLRAKRLRYRYLAVPALLVRSGRRLVLKLHRGYAFLGWFVAALARLRALPAPAG